MAGTPSVSGFAADGSVLAESDNQTPIPGLHVEVIEETQTTPIAVHEVLTDRDGKPLSSIVVNSASEVIIQSRDEAIAKFAAAGAASTFADPLAPAIIATPMVNPAGACLAVIEGTPVVQFNYNNSSEMGAGVAVPITGLNSYLLRTPGSSSDDLLLNSVRAGDTDIIPETEFRAPEPDELSQLFTAGEGSFTVPHDPANAPLTWSFIGAETTVDNTTTICQDDVALRCERLSSKLIDQLVTQLHRTVSGTLKTAAKYMRIGRSPYLQTSAAAIRRIKAQADALRGAYVCPRGVVLRSSCRATRFPADDLFRTHTGIFSRSSPVKPKVFEKLRRDLDRNYQRFLSRTFPQEIVFCAK